MVAVQRGARPGSRGARWIAAAARPPAVVVRRVEGMDQQYRTTVIADARELPDLLRQEGCLD